MDNIYRAISSTHSGILGRRCTQVRTESVQQWGEGSDVDGICRSVYTPSSQRYPCLNGRRWRELIVMINIISYWYGSYPKDTWFLTLRILPTAMMSSLSPLFASCFLSRHLLLMIMDRQSITLPDGDLWCYKVRFGHEELLGFDSFIRVRVSANTYQSISTLPSYRAGDAKKATGINY